MSYILDALKKSEQERGHGNIPDVQTVHSSGLNYRSEKKSYWPYILIVAVLLNLLAIVYFILNKENIEQTATATQETNVTDQVKTESSVTSEKTAEADNLTTLTSKKNTEIKETATNTPASAIDDTIKTTKKTATIKADTNSRAFNNTTKIMDFHELPESIRQELPSITISAHVYSTNPAQRSIVINNNFMEEGEYVLDGLILYEITTDGAIFTYQGTLFNYGVVSGWQ
jgi:general secretion pathway protein B